jgi:hypothetical protein
MVVRRLRKLSNFPRQCGAVTSWRKTIWRQHCVPLRAIPGG